MVCNSRVVADVVAAPERDVAANLDERLHRIVLQDETVVTGRMLAQEGAAAADVADELVAEPLHLVILCGTHAVHPGVAECDEHLERRRWKAGRDPIERHERKVEERILPAVFGIDGETGHLVLGIGREVEVREPGDVASAEENDLCHSGVKPSR